jgi:outer membrane protein
MRGARIRPTRPRRQSPYDNEPKDPTMKPTRIALLLAAAGLATSAWGADLMGVYRDALVSDPVYQGARATYNAGIERLPQARAGYLPNVVGSASAFKNKLDRDYADDITYNNQTYAVTLTQPLFRWQNWVAYDQSKWQVAQAEANFLQARQDLILRVAQAYFDVLYAHENLRAVQAAKSAIEQQLESAKKNFEVGTATITDSHEAQARFDLAIAQEIAAESELEVKQRALQAIIGNEPGHLVPVRREATMSPPQPANVKDWVAAAESGSITVQVQQAVLEIASREVDRQRAGHYPTVDLVANKGNSTTFGSTLTGQLDTDFQNIGVQFSLPIFQGMGVVSRQREASANRAAAEANLEAARRNAALAARQYYLGVVNGMAQVRALRAALVSSQSALESNRLGYEVGVRINIDVLNAENQVYVTRRDLAKAMLDTIMAQFRLKAAIGSLAEDDVVAANALLDPAAGK